MNNKKLITLFVCGGKDEYSKLQCASWIESIFLMLHDELEIVFGCFCDLEGTTVQKATTVKGISTTLCCISTKETIKSAGEVIKTINPNSIIIFGTENPLNYQVLRACYSTGKQRNTAIFAQGFCSVCARHYVEGLPEKVVNMNTIRDCLRHDGIKKQILSFKERAEKENMILSECCHFIGRTTMDCTLLRLQNEKASYYKCRDILRPAFYEHTWSIKKCTRHTIFISQYYYPLKGFHYLLEAADLIKKKYPDLKIMAAGYNPIRKGFEEKELKDSSYIRYIKRLVCRYSLQNHIVLLGQLDEEQMVEQYLQCNVFVMPSTIENSPNSLAEAMQLGVPCVASDVGGVSDYAVHGEEAFLYPSSAIYLLAHYIDAIFSDDDLAEHLGQFGKQRALNEYDRNKNARTFHDVVVQIANMSDTL